MRVELTDVMGNDEKIAKSAWVSTAKLDEYDKLPKEEKLERQKKVIDFCVQNKHRSVLRGCAFSFKLTYPIFTDRHFVTHQTMMGMVGESQRYTSNDGIVDIPDDMPSWLVRKVLDTHTEYGRSLERLYKEMPHNRRRARELARYMQLVSSTTTRDIHMNLDTFVSVIDQRLSDHAQLETRAVARAMMQEVKACGRFPIFLNAIANENWWGQ